MPQPRSRSSNAFPLGIERGLQLVTPGFNSLRLNSALALPPSVCGPCILTAEVSADRLQKSGHTAADRGTEAPCWGIEPKPEFGSAEVRLPDSPRTIAQPSALHGRNDMIHTVYRCEACHLRLDATVPDQGTDEQGWLFNDVSATLNQSGSPVVALRADDDPFVLRDELRQAGECNSCTTATRASPGASAAHSRVACDQFQRRERSLP